MQDEILCLTVRHSDHCIARQRVMAGWPAGRTKDGTVNKYGSDVARIVQEMVLLVLVRRCAPVLFKSVLVLEPFEVGRF